MRLELLFRSLLHRGVWWGVVREKFVMEVVYDKERAAALIKIETPPSIVPEKSPNVVAFPPKLGSVREFLATALEVSAGSKSG